MPTRAPDQCLQAHNQFVHFERLGQVVVGARGKTGQLVGPARARGQHQHRQLAPGFAPALQHRHPDQLRQAEVRGADGLERELRLHPLSGAIVSDRVEE